VGRNDQLSAGLKSHQAPQDQPMPLRVQMELGLIDEDDPFSVSVVNIIGAKSADSDQLI